jgi:hypothetical protein
MKRRPGNTALRRGSVIPRATAPDGKSAAKKEAHSAEEEALLLRAEAAREREKIGRR